MMNSDLTGPATKPAYKAVMLGNSHAKSIAELIEITRQSLPEDELHFLKPKSPGQISAHFAAFNPAFGIFDNNKKLIACGLLCPLDPNDEHAVQNFPSQHLLSGHWALQSIARHPDYKGHKLMDIILNHAKTYAEANPHIDYVVAKVSDRNAKSKNGFLGAGFIVASRGQDMQAGYPVVYLRLATEDIARKGAKPVQLGNDDIRSHTPIG